MITLDWINSIRKDGLLCSGYCDKLDKIRSKREMMDIILDANGIRFVPEMERKGYRLDYCDIQEEFGKYLNGNYIYHDDSGYTSQMYCQYNTEDKEEIFVDTTQICFLGCNADIVIDDWRMCVIVVDSGSNIRVRLGEGSKAVIEVYGKGKVFVVGEYENGRVKIKRYE